MERTLILVKPDGVQRGLVGPIIERFERRGVKIAGLKLIHPSKDLAEQHYAEHVGKPFFDGLVRFITSRPVVAMVLEGPNVIQMCRTTIGSTKPLEAAPGTVRGDFGTDTGRNLVHASANADDAARELGLWFKTGEILDYERETQPWIVEP